MSKASFARHLTLTLLVALFIPISTASAAPSEVVAQGLNDPRGIAAGDGRLLVVETGSGAITEIRKGRDGPVTSTFATVPGASDIVNGRHGKAYALRGPFEEGGDPVGELVKIDRDGDFSLVADIAAYQLTDPDPFDVEDNPGETNPFGLASLGHHGLLVADAASNDLLHIDKDGTIETVARFPTKELPFPEGIPEGPPPGTLVPTEAVPTAVAVGPDGAWYVSELTGFPFTKGASRIWRIKPGTKDHNCDAEATRGPCRVVADGFTSVIDITFGGDTLYVLELAKEGLFAVEQSGAPPIGALWAVEDGKKTEILPGTLLAPGGVVAPSEDTLYVTTGTLFGPGAGAVVRIHPPDDEDDHHGDGGGKPRHHHGKKHRRHHGKHHKSSGHRKHSRHGNHGSRRHNRD